MDHREKGHLLLVGTPIGNLSDFSPRGKEALQSADFIAAEDTRVTRKLLTHFGIKKELLSYYEQNEQVRAGPICDRILAGEICALVSDAGMPAISDPGEYLVSACIARGIPVYTVPGPSALTAAISLSGLPTGRFCFEGFLSINKKNRRRHLKDLSAESRTIIFYEAPHKLAATLRDMLAAWGDRPIALARELTKIHEEVIRTTLADAAQFYAENKARGEFVLMIQGAPEPAAQAISPEEGVRLAQALIEKGVSLSAAAKEAANQTGGKRNEIYKALLTKSDEMG